MKQPASAKAQSPRQRSSAPSPPAREAPIHEASGAELTRIQASLTGGAPLPLSTKQRMEAGFGGSFADVRVHTGGAAAAATRTLSAEAFTTGRDIAFSPGTYRPGTTAGDRLIAHELAHVVQQRRSGGGGTVQAKSVVSQPGDAAEAAADRAADTVLSGGRAQVAAGGHSLRGRIMRRARHGASALSRSPALTQAPRRPGAPAPGAGQVMTPAMTSTVSPAGGGITGLDRGGGAGRAEPSAKSPDETQTARGDTAGTATSPANVVTAGVPASGAEAAESGPKRQQKRDGRRDRKASEAEGERERPGRRRGGGGGGAARRKKGRFGENLGDRGAGAAAAARQRLDQRADAMQVTEGAGTRIEAARAAAEPPPDAAQADGQRQQAGTLAGAEVPAPDAAAAQERARATLQSAAPTTIEELDRFAGPGGAATRERIAQSIAADAERQIASVQQSMSAVSSPPAGSPPPPAVPQPDPMPALGSPAPELAAATPPPVPEESLDATEFRAEADAALSEHDVDDPTLEKAEEGPLRAIGDDKKNINQKVENAADRARGQEAQALGTAEAQLAEADSGAVGGMAEERETGQAGVGAVQHATRTGEETEEQSLVDQITSIYQTAEQTVNERLGSLQDDAVESFRERQGQMLEAFSSGVRADLDAFKDRRYSGVRGVYYRVRDWVKSINSVPEVQALYERHRQRYITTIDQLLAQIKAGIEETITTCKETLESAKTEIDELIAANEGQLDADAQAALQAAQEWFRAMETRIDQTRQSALAALDRERERAIAEMDRALDEIRAENAGLVDKIANAIAAIAAALGQFMRLLARVTRMGVGVFISAALAQAQKGIRNNLWGELQNAFREWIFQKLPILQLLLNMPPNWMEMLTALATNMISLFTENLPAMLPAIGVAAMTWLATTLAAKLIPGVGAIMAVIDGIRAAWGLVQSLLSAASGFLQFVMQVAARGNGAVALARALAHGIVAGLDAILTFLGVDRLIRRVVGAIARPFGRIVNRIMARFRTFMQRRRQRSGGRRRGDRRRERDDGDDRGPNANARRSAQSRADRDRHDADRRARGRDRRPDRRESDAERRRRQRREEERRRRERLNEAVQAITPAVDSLLTRGVSRLRLRAQLAIWRVRHRIRKLALQGNVVVAGNSNDWTVRRVLSGNEDGIYRMVEDIGRERMRRAAARRQGRVGSAAGGPHSIVPGDPPHVLAAGLEARGEAHTPRSRGDPERAGGTFPIQVGFGRPVYASQGAGPVASPAVRRNIFIRGLGRRGSYPEIADRLTAMGLNGPGVAEAVAETLSTGEGPIYIKRLIALIYGREPLQFESSAATGLLTLGALHGGTHQGVILGAEGQPVVGRLYSADYLDPLGDNGNRLGGGVAPFTVRGAAADQRAAFGARARAQVLRTIELVYHAVRQMEFKDTTSLRREILTLFDMIDRAHGVNP